MSQEKVSIIIPVYNEETGIGELLEKLLPIAQELGAEVIVVDDGSRDGTGEILAGYFEQGKIQLITHSENQGYGRAIKSGLQRAGGEKILILDGDGSYPLEAIPELVKKSEQAEMVVGARKSGLKVEPIMRRLFKWLINKLLRYLAGYQVRDLNSGMRIFSRSLVLPFLSLLPDGFSFTSTLSLIFLSQGWNIEYLEIAYQPRKGKSKFSFREIFPLSLLLLRTIIYFNPLKFFVPLSIFLFFLALFVALFSIFVLGKFMDVTTAVLLIGAVQVFVLGLLADLILRLKK